MLEVLQSLIGTEFDEEEILTALDVEGEIIIGEAVGSESHFDKWGVCECQMVYINDVNSYIYKLYVDEDNIIREVL